MTLKVHVKVLYIHYNPIQDLPNMHLIAEFGGPCNYPSKVFEWSSPFLADFDRFYPPMTLKSKFSIQNPITNLTKIQLIAKVGGPSTNPSKVIE